MRTTAVFSIIAMLALCLMCSKGATSQGGAAKGGTMRLAQTSGGQSDTQNTSMMDKGIGPIKQVTLGPVDPNLALGGQRIFNQKCAGCHAFDKHLVGPSLGSVTVRRSPEFIMNMILDPAGMEANDSIVKAQVSQYKGIKMPNAGLDSAQARAVLEFARTAPKQ